MQEAGVAFFTAHDLRRSAATGIARLGHAAVVPDILNHSPQGITRQVYDKYGREPEIKAALIAWEHAVAGALGGETGRTVVEVDFS
jgi:integrase